MDFFLLYIPTHLELEEYSNYSRHYGIISLGFPPLLCSSRQGAGSPVAPPPPASMAGRRPPAPPPLSDFPSLSSLPSPLSAPAPWPARPAASLALLDPEQGRAAAAGRGLGAAGSAAPRDRRRRI